MGVELERGLAFGRLEKGKRNLITDVPGVKVGHCTIKDGDVNTGVTALIPHGGDIFHEKCPAAVHVINGFGKSCGLVQVEELGTLETPVMLTNTLSVGTVSTALIEYMLERNEDIGLTTGTVNPLVMECNDGGLSDIRGLHVTKAHARAALDAAGEAFDEGDVGAGTGMSCYSLKGGIGSSSRKFTCYGKEFTLGTLLLTNFGTLRDLVVCGERIGKKLYDAAHEERDKGSVITIIATDAPLSDRQLLRAAKRAQSGLARTGSISGNGSGEIVLAFSTVNLVPHYSDAPISSERFFEDDMDTVFRAVIECVEESVISSLLHAKTLVGRAGKERKSLSDMWVE